MIQQIGLNQGKFWETAPKKETASSNFLALFQAEQAKGMTARQYLPTLTPDKLATLQKASHLAAPIDIAKISEEGAHNLLAEGDQSKLVDLKNDAVTEALNEQGNNNSSIWDELSERYDIHHATFDELCAMSYRLYEAKQISLVDHATLSFDPSRIPQAANAKLYFTPADQAGKRDWIAEYKARAEFELKQGKTDDYQYILSHFVQGILCRLERK